MTCTKEWNQFCVQMIIFIQSLSDHLFEISKFNVFFRIIHAFWCVYYIDVTNLWYDHHVRYRACVVLNVDYIKIFKSKRCDSWNKILNDQHELVKREMTTFVNSNSKKTIRRIVVVSIWITFNRLLKICFHLLYLLENCLLKSIKDVQWFQSARKNIFCEIKFNRETILTRNRKLIYRHYESMIVTKKNFFYSSVVCYTSTIRTFVIATRSI